MPIYEYRCQSCNHEMEALVRSGKEPETCPECQGPLARKISRAGVIFKGSGFYVNDSRGSSSGGSGASKSSNGGGGEAAKSDTGGGGGESKGGESKSSSESSSSTKKADTSSKSSD